MTLLFLKGLVVGFSIAAPIGPIGVLCISRTLSGGIVSGLVTGLAAATADGVYGSVAAFGLTAISDFLVGHSFQLKIGGGLLLILLGIKALFFDSSPIRRSSSNLLSFSRDYWSAFFLTITNPVTIIVFGAIFAGFGLGFESSDHISAFAAAFGVFAGSLLWWVTLSAGVALLSAKLGERLTRGSQRLSAFILMTFGIITSISAFRP